MGANCWVEGIGGTSWSQEERGDTRKERRSFSAVLWRKEDAARPQGELEPAASAQAGGQRCLAEANSNKPLSLGQKERWR